MVGEPIFISVLSQVPTKPEVPPAVRFSLVSSWELEPSGRVSVLT